MGKQPPGGRQPDRIRTAEEQAGGDLFIPEKLNKQSVFFLYIILAALLNNRQNKA
jgi:hypothetical protein